MALKFNQLLPNIVSKVCNHGQLPHHRAPVLRCSKEAGTFEQGWWHPPEAHDPDCIYKAARNFTITSRNKKRAGEASPLSLSRPLTAAALDVLEWLCMMARLCNGRLFPSYDAIIEATGRCRQSVARALNQLEIAGLLERQRRCKRHAEKGQGPRFIQTSNVYRLQLPKSLRKFLPRAKQTSPVPQDQQARLEADGHNLAAMIHQERKTPLTELLPASIAKAVLAIDDPILRSRMESMAFKLIEREYDLYTQTPLKSLSMNWENGLGNRQ